MYPVHLNLYWDKCVTYLLQFINTIIITYIDCFNKYLQLIINILKMSLCKRNNNNDNKIIVMLNNFSLKYFNSIQEKILF